MFHGLQDLRLRKKQTGAAQFLLPLAGKLFRRDLPLRAEDVVPGREVEHPRRDDLPVESRFPTGTLSPIKPLSA